MPSTRVFKPSVQWDPQVWQYLSESFGPEHWANMAAQLVKPPLSLCFRISRLRATMEEAVKELTASLNERTNEHDQEPLKVRLLPVLSNVVVVDATGPHDVEISSARDDTGVLREIVVDRKCGEAVLRGAPVYVPGVLGCSPQVQAGDRVVVSMADEAMTRGTVLGSDHDKGSLDARESLFLGVGVVAMGRSEIFRSKSGLAVTMKAPVFSIPPAEGLLSGKAMLQNLPSAVAAAVLAPKPGSRILDMCAAPGGKTTAVAELVGDNAEIIALDRSHSKVGNIHDLAEELGLTCIKAYKMDATKAVLKPLSPEVAEASKPSGGDVPSAKAIARQQRREAAMRARGVEPPAKKRVFEPPCKGWPPGSFDFILLDAPCTGLGLRPRLSQTMTLSELDGTAVYQRKLISTAVELLRPGGTLVFSTCSINPGENEANVRYAIDNFPCLELVPAEPRLGGPGLVSRADGKDSREAWLTEAESQLVQRFDPASSLDTIGFFISKFRKREVA